MSNTIEAGNNVAVGVAAGSEDSCGNMSNSSLSGYYTAQPQPCPTCGRCPTCGQYRYPPGSLYYHSYTGYSWGGGIQSAQNQNIQAIN